jgi:hypothetical protein
MGRGRSDACLSIPEGKIYSSAPFYPYPNSRRNSSRVDTVIPGLRAGPLCDAVVRLPVKMRKRNLKEANMFATVGNY